MSVPCRAKQESRLHLPVDCTVHLFAAHLSVGVMAKPHDTFWRSTAAPKTAVAHGRISPATRNRTRDHLITALVYSQMLCQLSYSRGWQPLQQQRRRIAVFTARHLVQLGHMTAGRLLPLDWVTRTLIPSFQYGVMQYAYTGVSVPR